MTETKHTYYVTLAASLGGVERSLPLIADRFSIRGQFIRTGIGGESVCRVSSTLRRWIAVGRLPSDCRPIFDALGAPKRARWGSTVTMTLAIDDTSPDSVTWERAEVHLLELAANAEHIWVLMDVSGYRKRSGVAISHIEHANCMMCGEEKRPGKVASGVNGDVVVLCDNCVTALRTGYDLTPSNEGEVPPA